MQWLLYFQIAMQALTALESVDGGVAAVVKEVNGTISAAQADGNRDPTEAERASLDGIIKDQMAKLDAA